MTDNLQSDRVSALQQLMVGVKATPIPTQPNARTFYCDGDVWLVESGAENEIHWRAIADTGMDMVQCFRKTWQYIGQYNGNMFIYRLIPWRS